MRVKACGGGGGHSWGQRVGGGVWRQDRPPRMGAASHQETPGMRHTLEVLLPHDCVSKARLAPFGSSAIARTTQGDTALSASSKKGCAASHSVHSCHGFVKTGVHLLAAGLSTPPARKQALPFSSPQCLAGEMGPTAPLPPCHTYIPCTLRGEKSGRAKKEARRGAPGLGGRVPASLARTFRFPCPKMWTKVFHNKHQTRSVSVAVLPNVDCYT